MLIFVNNHSDLHYQTQNYSKSFLFTQLIVTQYLPIITSQSCHFSTPVLVLIYYKKNLLLIVPLSLISQFPLVNILGVHQYFTGLWL